MYVSGVVETEVKSTEDAYDLFCKGLLDCSFLADHENGLTHATGRVSARDVDLLWIHT